jgi:hypothetical protein
MAISLNSSFGLQASLPLDDRTVAVDLVARNAIVAGRRFEGLEVYVLSEKTTYRLVGGILDANWKAEGTGTGGANVPSNDPVIDCSSDVIPDMLVYIDPADGKAKPALANSTATMPAKFYVTSKPTALTCTVTKDIIKAVAGQAGKTLFVSETIPGSVQTSIPTAAGTVIQTVGECLFGNRNHYSISDRITVRA